MNILNNIYNLNYKNWDIIGILALMSIILTLPPCAVAAPPTSAQVALADKYFHTYYSWLNAPWTDDDRPYQRLRAEIEKAISDKENPFDLLKLRQKDLEKAPTDPQAQFAYYYTGYQAVTWSQRDDKNDNEIGLEVLGNLFIALIRMPHPHTYNYARLAFLCGQYNFADPNRSKVGIRLVRRDPNDYDVKYYTILSLMQSTLPAEQALALTYAHDLIKNYPQKPSSHSIAASLHYRSWLRTKNKREAAEAISEFQQYLQLEPTRFQFRKQAEQYIAQMQRG